MKLIDKDLVDLALQYGSQDSIPDPVVIARYICTTSPATWLLTWFDPQSEQASGYRIGLGDEDGWGLFSILEIAKWLIPTDTFFFDRVSGRTVHRQSYGRIMRDAHFTPRRLPDCIPFSERTLGIAELGKKSGEIKQAPVMMKSESIGTPA